MGRIIGLTLRYVAYTIAGFVVLWTALAYVGL